MPKSFIRLTSKTVVRDRGAKRIAKALRSLRDEAAVGFVGAKAGVVEKDHGDLTNAQLGAIHEFGATVTKGGSTTVIPERSFMRSSFDLHQQKYINSMRRGVGRVIDGSLTGKSLVEITGLQIESDIKAKLQSGPFKELSEATLRDRRRKGIVGERPLIATGTLRMAVETETRKRR